MRGKRQIKRRNAVKAMPRRCHNCGCWMSAGHFVPPSFGEPGFYICDRYLSSDMIATK